MRSWTKRASASVAAVAVIVPLGVGAANRIEYGGVDPWSPPERLTVCGAKFYRHDDGPHVSMLGDGAVVTREQALGIADAKTLVAHGTTGMFGQWNVFVPSGLECPQDPQESHDSWMFISLGPDRYLDLTDAD